ncbi:MAG: class I SAM-dependent methyltransferase [Desulfobacterales bacterium]
MRSLPPSSERPSTDELVRYLRSRTKGIRFANRIQMVNRPRICPFDDLLALLPAGCRVVDIGCGNGTFMLLLAHFRTPSRLMGIDVDPGAVDAAGRIMRSFHPGVSDQVRFFDGVALPPEVRTADYVFLVDVLHHVPVSSQKPFLESLFHTMQPGATLVLKDIDAGRWLLEKFNRLHDQILARQKVHAIRAGDAERWLTDIGFSTSPVRKKRLLWYPHYTIVAGKPC